MRQYVCAVHTLNSTLEQLPPAFDANLKIPDSQMMDILAFNFPRSHRELMTDQDFDAQTATTDQFVEICECAKSEESIRSKPRRHDQHDDSSEDESPIKKSTKKHHSTDSFESKKWLPHFCKEHGPKTTHDSKNCKVIHGSKKSNDWKKKETSDSTDYKSKYKKKSRELNLLQLETKKEKAKWTK